MVYEHTVVDLIRDGDDRVVGIEVEGPEGARRIDSDLVVACDGVMSPTRAMAGLDATVDDAGRRDAHLDELQPTELAFKMNYLSDGGHIGMLSWFEGSAGWRTIDKVGREAALAPGLDAIKQHVDRADAGGGGGHQRRHLRSTSSATASRLLLSCERWWIPGLVIIGDAAHFFGPETGRQLRHRARRRARAAQAILQNPDDADAACRSYELWRTPVVRPYEAMDPGRQRLVLAGGVTREEERWPPAS